MCAGMLVPSLLAYSAVFHAPPLVPNCCNIATHSLRRLSTPHGLDSLTHPIAVGLRLSISMPAPPSPNTQTGQSADVRQATAAPPSTPPHENQGLAPS